MANNYSYFMNNMFEYSVHQLQNEPLRNNSSYNTTMASHHPYLVNNIYDNRSSDRMRNNNTPNGNTHRRRLRFPTDNRGSVSPIYAERRNRENLIRSHYERLEEMNAYNMAIQMQRNKYPGLSESDHARIAEIARRFVPSHLFDDESPSAIDQLASYARRVQIYDGYESSQSSDYSSSYTTSSSSSENSYESIGEHPPKFHSSMYDSEYYSDHCEFGIEIDR